MDYPKIELTKTFSLDSGNLKSKQSFKIDYYLKTDKFPDKVRLCIIAPGKSGEDSYLSLFLLDPAQIDIIILELIKARSYFKKQRGDLSGFNMHYYQEQFSRKYLEIEKEVLKGDL